MLNMNFFCAACNIYISSHSVRFSFHVHSNEKVIRFTQQHLPRLKVKFTCNICLVRTSRDPSFLDILHIVHWKCFYIRFELVMRYFQFRQRMKFTFPCTWPNAVLILLRCGPCGRTDTSNTAIPLNLVSNFIDAKNASIAVCQRNSLQG